MKKSILTLLILAFILPCFTFNTASAIEDTSGLDIVTLLPHTTVTDCKGELDILSEAKDPLAKFKEKTLLERDDILGCAIKTGRIHFWMVPYYIVYLIEFLIGIAGLIAVLFLVVGGFQYVASGLSETKDKAKGTIKNALLGLGVVLAAWTVVNMVQYLVTL